ncbi:pyridoxal phosphate-dependent aminotransferase [Clostridium botulinum]|uniref:Aminotransferase n=1 Tax=Clostridium botulinum D str. 1873 TaxID=592027 RepID=A0A9P2G731_CLOBO|nr:MULTISPECIES: pyridoxal phosphate-dependent aminotransferase [Clostridium]AYF54825.1 pyridoxal phosphate-dependent aminotransferase [Clostridium novyi]EES91146.1 aspartate aminotransferase [Clostridium botulinum D str. 1873]MBO3440983.1 pyridoxal phosphate-dependent aminotransferase [Clostridium haemolyticum]NFV47755.1 pyridoxal phosphate-dependent aminotransferase [Clostridium botulinum]QPW56315.1 pyridoxal phosphate-dependent aminotransferase [Clostridium botulinum]
MILSKKAKDISPSLTLSITAKAKEISKQGKNIISFGVGEPDFDTPINIQKAAIKAIENGFTRYTPASGIPELKKAIVEKFKKDNNLMYDIDNIIISTGAKQCLANIFSAILNPGDEVLVPIPYWVSYPELIKLNDGVPVFVHNSGEDNYKYTEKSLQNALSKKTKAIIVNSPNNPTGAIYSKDELIKIANFAKENDLIIISDEIYEKLIYGDNKHISIASLNEDSFKRTIVINGVSKSYAMTGWRIGYAAASKEIIKLMSSIQSHTTSNPNSIAQYAALEALTGSQDSLYAMVEEFEKRKNYMVSKIDSMKNVSCINAEGAFYIMLNVSNFYGRKNGEVLINGSMDFASELLNTRNVAVIPGIAFGADEYIRLSYANSMNNIKEGLNIIEDFMNNLT